MAPSSWGGSDLSSLISIEPSIQLTKGNCCGGMLPRFESLISVVSLNVWLEKLDGGLALILQGRRLWACYSNCLLDHYEQFHT